MNKTTNFLLLSSSCIAVLFSLGNAYGHSNSTEELYDECVGATGKTFCDFLFKR